MREFTVTIIGLLAAALSTSLVLALVAVGPFAEVPLLLMLLLFSYALAPALLFGVLFVVLRSFHAVRWWSAAVGGVAVGALLGTLLPGTNARILEVCVLAGTVTGLVFWAVWRTGMRHRALGVEGPSPNDVPSA